MADFTQMTGPELVAAYNEMARKRPEINHVTKFETVTVGVRRCQDLERTLAAHSQMIEDGMPAALLRAPSESKPLPVPAHNPAYAERVEEANVQNEADKRWRNWVPVPGMMSRPRKATFAKIVREERKILQRTTIDSTAEAQKNPSLGTASKSKRADKVVRIKTPANPRRAGTDAHRFFEAMRGSPTVGQYLAKFSADEQKKASQWLYNTCEDGFAELLG